MGRTRRLAAAIPLFALLAFIPEGAPAGEAPADGARTPAEPKAAAAQGPAGRKEAAARLFRQGNDSFQKGQDAYEGLLGATDPVPLLQAAGKAFTEVVRDYPGEDRAADAALFLGTTLLLLDRMDQALEAYERAYALFPGGKDRHLALLRAGICQAGLGDPVKAKASFEKYLQDFPDRKAEALKARRFIQELSLVGRPAAPLRPQRWLTGVAGEEGLRTFDGQVVALVFFATWCPNCRKELPHLRSLMKRFGASDVVFIGVADPEDPQAKTPIEAYVQDNRLEFADVALDAGSTSSRPYQVAGYPAACILDRKGIVRWRGHLGFFPSLLVERLLGEGTKPAAGAKSP